MHLTRIGVLYSFIFNLSTLSVHDYGYAKNELCALNLISTIISVSIKITLLLDTYILIDYSICLKHVPWLSVLFKQLISAVLLVQYEVLGSIESNIKLEFQTCLKIPKGNQKPEIEGQWNEIGQRQILHRKEWATLTNPIKIEVNSGATDGKDFLLY